MRLWRDRKDQRTVEYPFVFRNLPHLRVIRAPPRPRVLDVGCVESELAKELAKLGNYEVYAIDIRDYDTKGLPIKFVKEDIRNPVFEADFFDIVLAVSTIEHVGLDWYSNTWMHEDGDVAAMRQIFRILKPGGIAIVTVDAGMKGEPWFRVYNMETIKKLTEGWKICVLQWFQKGAGSNPAWQECSGEEASCRLSVGYAEACACMVLKK